MKKVLLSTIALLAYSAVSSVSAAYEEVSCATDEAFSAYSCVQCFNGGEKEEGANLGLLTDVWSNGTSKSMYMLKAENELTDSVRMFALNDAAWSYEPSEENFWEYSDGLESLSSDEGFYTLEAGKSVDWIGSKLGYSIKLNKSAEEGKNIGLLKYTLNVHLDEGGFPATDTTSHTECVLFKSAAAGVTPVTPEVPKELPQTGPQEVLLLLLSLLLAGGLFFVSKRKA